MTTFTLKFIDTEAPAHSRTPAETRLQHLAKIAEKGLGLRCIDVTPADGAHTVEVGPVDRMEDK